MTIRYIEKPDKTLHVDNWVIYIYIERNTAICFKNNGKACYVVKDTTDEIRHLPAYVLKALHKEGFLARWRETKIKQILDRLNEICEKLEKMEVKK